MSGESGRPPPEREWPNGTEVSAVDPTFESELGEDLLSEIVLDSASECFVVVDEQNRMVFANQVVEELFGYEPSEVVGERLTELIPPEYREPHLTAFAEYLRTGERTVDWDYLEFPGLHRDGHEFPLMIALREFTREDDHYFVGVMRDNADRVEDRERLASEKAFVESILDALPDVVYAFDKSGQFIRWNDKVNEVTGYADDEIADMYPLEFIPERDHQRIAESIHRVTTDGVVETVQSAIVTKDGTETPYEFTGAPLIEDGEILGQTGMGRDISERKRRQEQLGRLNELNTVIRSVDQALIEASTPEEIETAVCDQLVTEGGYVGAVTGDLQADAETLTVHASAGVDPHMFETGALHADGTDIPLPTRARQSRSVQVATELREDATESCQRDARNQGYDAVAAIPIVQEDRTFGVLGAYSDRTGAFEKRERTILRELGESVGNAIQSALTRQLLYTNTVTEIELRSTDANIAIVALSAEADCRLDLTRALSYGDDVMLYFSVTGAKPQRVLDDASSVDDIVSAEYFGTHGVRHRFQFVVTQGTITAELSKYGARAVTGEADSGVGYLTVLLPPAVDVRTFVDGLKSNYSETELVRRQEVEQSLQTPTAFRRELSAEMTEKQQAALEAAYFAGYFEWPSRTCSAEDVAEMLDIAPQTFHQHLRVAQEKLLRGFFHERVSDEVQ